MAMRNQVKWAYIDSCGMTILATIKNDCSAVLSKILCCMQLKQDKPFICHLEIDIF